MKSAIYIRVSTQEQAKSGYSLGEQQERLTKYAGAMGYEIVGTYIDDGLSGKSLNRPAIQRLIAAINAGQIDLILVWKIDRLSRRVKDVLELVDLLIAKSAKLFSLNENIDFATPYGRAALTMAATFAELEREVITERSKMGKDARARSGKALATSYYPIGYTYNKDTKSFSIIPEEAEQVRKMFELYLAGWSFRKIALYMAQNYTNRYGSYANYVCVKRVVTNPFSSGYFRWKGEIIKAENYEPIIDLETYLQAEKLYKQRRQHITRDNSPYLLTGIAKCGLCGATYSAKRYHLVDNGKDYLYIRYGCTKRLRYDYTYDTEPPCKNRVLEQKYFDNQITEILKGVKVKGFINPTVAIGSVGQLMQDNVSLKDKQKKLLDVYLEGVLNKSAFTLKNDEIQLLIDRNDKLIASIKETIQPVPIPNVTDINQRIQEFEALSVSEKRRLLKAIIRDIIIANDDIQINWNVILAD